MWLFLLHYIWTATMKWKIIFKIQINQSDDSEEDDKGIDIVRE